MFSDFSLIICLILQKNNWNKHLEKNTFKSLKIYYYHIFNKFLNLKKNQKQVIKIEYQKYKNSQSSYGDEKSNFNQ